MATGLIKSPVTWSNGTIFTPTWGQSVQDNINNLPSAYALPATSSLYTLPPPYIYFDDFTGFATLTSAGYIGPMVYGFSNGKAILAIVNDANGAVRLTNDSGGVWSLGGTLYPGKTNTRDWAYRVKVQVSDIANNTFILGFQSNSSPGVVSSLIKISSASSFLQVLLDSSGYPSYTNTTGSVIDDTWYVIEVTRISNVLTIYLDGVSVFSNAYATDMNQSDGYFILTASGASGESVYIDWMSLAIARQ